MDATTLAFAISARAPVTTLAIVATAGSFILQVVRICMCNSKLYVHAQLVTEFCVMHTLGTYL